MLFGGGLADYFGRKTFQGNRDWQKERKEVESCLQYIYGAYKLLTRRAIEDEIGNNNWSRCDGS